MPPFVADLHVHSRFSRATSRDLDLPHLFVAAQQKGVSVVGTGDFTHPAWQAELQAQLVPAEDGFFALRPELARAAEAGLPAACRRPVRFVYTAEISTIYKAGDVVRKVHHLLLASGPEPAARLSAALSRIGNLHSDGRPILGLDSRDLLETVLMAGGDSALIPAHIWTPWFSALGDRSGFPSIDACYRDLAPHVFAVETGLSSDPPMNWRVSALDRYALVSHSDAHSPDKLAREADLFDTEFGYAPLLAALRGEDAGGFLGTLEFFPEEGKYHLDGHRACGVRLAPAETRAHAGLCPVCRKPVTVGVLHRVERLADRPEGARPASARRFERLVPLAEVVGQTLGTGPQSAAVRRELQRLRERLGPELHILRELPLADLRRGASAALAEAIGRMRRGEVEVQGGFDGEYGTIRVVPAPSGALPGKAGPAVQPPAGEAARPARSGLPLFDPPTALPSPGREPASLSGLPLFDRPSPAAPPVPPRRADSRGADDAGPVAAVPSTGVPEAAAPVSGPAPPPASPSAPDAVGRGPAAFPGAALLGALNVAQARAAAATDVPVLVVAGPGTGKTRTLVYRLAVHIAAGGLRPERALAVTFTNRAAAELRLRLGELIGPAARHVNVSTFHALALRILAAERGTAPRILDDAERRQLLLAAAATLGRTLSAAEADTALAAIAQKKNGGCPGAAADPTVDPLTGAYEAEKQARGLLDLDDLVPAAIEALASTPTAAARWAVAFEAVAVDEFQDVNAAQYALVRQLAPTGRGLFAIGDPDQAIYGFRGADIVYFEHFQRDYPTTELVRLQRNYRSSPQILGASAGVIGRNPSRVRVELAAERPDGARLLVVETASERAEAEFVAHTIEQWLGGLSLFSFDSGRAAGPGRAFGFADIAVLYRLGAQAGAFAEAFGRLGLPFLRAGGEPPWARPAARALLAHARLAVAPADGAAFARAAREPPRGLGERFVAQVAGLAAAHGGSHVAALATWLAAAKSGRTRAAAAALLAEQRELLAALAAERPAAEVLRTLAVRVGLLASVPASASAPDPIAELLALALLHGGPLPAFLGWLELAEPADAYDPRAERVALLTLHAAKGLEFPLVFLTGCEDGLLPYVHPGEAADRGAEERRLFYVGMTRARQHLVLTRARRRRLFGVSRCPAPSPFLADIASVFTEFGAPQAAKPRSRPVAPAPTQLALW